MFKKIKFAVIALLMAGLGFPVIAVAQEQVTVSGTVSDAIGPMMGVGIMEAGTSNGTVTDLDGNFTLKVFQGATLEVSSLGYKTLTIEVGSQTAFNLIMEEDNEALEEVVVVGYGVQKKKLVTGSTVQVKGDDVAKMNTTSALGALQSMTPGVNITSTNNQPGEGFKVNIRGLGTVGDSAPLYVIDGVAGGDINTLNPADIESIDVLKDAASAAIYGSRAANGVILVTTKQGKAGKMQVSYDGYVGFQNLYKKPGMLNAQETMAMQDEAAFNSGAPMKDWQNLLGSRVWGMLQNGWTGTDWLEEIRVKNAPTTNHALNLAGGNEFSKFSAGFSYTKQDGILGKPVAPSYDRYTGRLNSSHVVYNNGDRDVVSFGENLTFYYSTHSGIAELMAEYNDVRQAMMVTPLLPAYDANGNLYDVAAKDADGWNLDVNTANPLLPMTKDHGLNNYRNYGLNATAYVDIAPFKFLKYHGAFSYRMSGTSGRTLAIPYKASVDRQNDSYTVNQSAFLGHSISYENTLTYTMPKKGDFSFDALVGQSFEKTGTGESLSAGNSVVSGSQVPTMLPDMQHAWLDNVNNVLSGVSIGGSPSSEWALLSFFGRANFNYAEKYMLTLIARADGSSNFARGHRWGFFPSVSAGWVMTEEDFMKDVSWLNFLKLRVSWGQNGNQSISNFQYLSPVAFDNSHVYNFGETVLSSTGAKSVGAYVKNLANPDVTWETSEQWDLGTDIRMFKSRLSLAFDYYIKYTKDWLVQAPVLATAGTAAPYINGGDVRNSGVELSLGWNDQVGKDFSYNTSLNFSYNRNRVTRIANDEGIIHGAGNQLGNDRGVGEFYRAQVDYPIGYFWGFETAGVFQNQAEIDAWRAKGDGFGQSSPQPGDLIYVDQDHNGVIDDNDKVMIGNPHPDFRLGFNASIAWKGLDLGLTLNGAFGQQLLYAYRDKTTQVFDRWYGEGTSNRLPRLGDGAQIAGTVSDIDIENGDFLKVQNITLGYDLKHLFKNMPLGQVRLYVSAQNLYTFTKYPGMDPEVGFGGYGVGWVSGIDVGAYPAARTILFGVNIKY